MYRPYSLLIFRNLDELLPLGIGPLVVLSGQLLRPGQGNEGGVFVGPVVLLLNITTLHRFLLRRLFFFWFLEINTELARKIVEIASEAARVDQERGDSDG